MAKSETQQNALAIFGAKSTPPAHIESSGRGMNMTQDDITYPYISILQALSPQIDEVPGAKAGLFHNSITNELSEELVVCSLAFRREYAVFRQRKLGGGFEGSFDSASDAQAKVASLDNPNDYEVIETHRHVLLQLDPNTGDAIGPVVFNMSGTKVRVSKTWNTDMLTRHKDGQDRFASVWVLRTRKQSNTQGSWYNLATDFLGWAPEGTYNAAKKFYEDVTGSAVAKATENVEAA